MMITNTHNLKITYMKSLSFRKDLIGVQDELLRFAYKLTTDREEANDLLQETSLKALDNEDKYTPDTNFKGWMYTIMRNIFINNYRKVVRDQTFVDQTENLYHLNLPQDSGFESTESPPVSTPLNVQVRVIVFPLSFTSAVTSRSSSSTLMVSGLLSSVNL